MIHPTNRFMAYALYPSVQHLDPRAVGTQQQNTVLAVGKSISTGPTNRRGCLMLTYGGGGHEAAGTCQVPNDQAQRVLEELLERINADG